MENITVTLTETDRIVLESYKQFAEGLSNYLGDGYEIVVHSLESLDNSVVKIINGFHSGRREGAPITDLALSMLSRIRETDDVPFISYHSTNKKSEPIKASTIAIKGENQRIIGLVCINFYLNTPFETILKNFQSRGDEKQMFISENFAENIGDVIENAVEQARQTVNGSPLILPSFRNKEIISILYGQGIFNLKDAVVQTADMLGISRNTVYMHLRNLNHANGQSEQENEQS
ncbi:helix-turn-helix transcriptional regulator [Papillibacter cinnamivorans]|uniref:Predicted transcriptional regulator YheO, contains PAS and DNA-binding HTH domains n=1 Tax=Papillibacter cinnamivorans DSM 12816 TaxID=1122930 RepID=A0A1W2BLI2_9FIRM|nr:PAS domain-containing protein [Papillibacter cinnamivorans]SMC73797.1 Predicted transcriptional regulator YheO, contains PAS and DNA-binding HTH domains [Papillibacter cinnamivorans DSM 12816]